MTEPPIKVLLWLDPVGAPTPAGSILPANILKNNPKITVDAYSVRVYYVPMFNVRRNEITDLIVFAERLIINTQDFRQYAIARVRSKTTKSGFDYLRKCEELVEGRWEPFISIATEKEWQIESYEKSTGLAYPELGIRLAEDSEVRR